MHVEHGPEHLTEAAGLAEAKCDALRYPGRLICEPADDFWDSAHFRMTVSDEAGLVLFALE